MGPIWKHAGIPIRIDVNPKMMGLAGQVNKLKNYIDKTNCILYLFGEVMSCRVPCRLLLGVSKHNFHTRPNYFAYLYYYAKKMGVKIVEL